MRDVFIASENILSPIGLTSVDNFSQLKRGVSGIKQHVNLSLADLPFYASLFDDKESVLRYNPGNYTMFEQLLIASVSDALENTGIDIGDKKTGLIISSTKGNIGLLETEKYTADLCKRIALHTSARLVANYFEVVNLPIIVSNACISGLLGILVGLRMIRADIYENVVIAGADVLSKFILSGFQAFNAVSGEPCRPFDRERCGITLGEGAATLILTSNPKHARGVKVLAGSTSNDANHISAPSRTGEELALAITKTLRFAGLSASDVDFISAHGTATIYNDEMEAKAFNLTQLQKTPINSLKGYYGHTLGAAGLIESIVSIHSLRENIVLPTMGFKQLGVDESLNICINMQHTALQNILKTASGFGGCNGVLAFNKL